MTYEDQILIKKSEYNELKEIAFKYNYLTKLILSGASYESGRFIAYGLSEKIESYFKILEPIMFETWKKHQPKEEE